jgi:outer membrane protein assembly factor BamB
LTTQNVGSPDFGKLWEYPVRGRIYAQPLYVAFPQSPHAPNGQTLVYVATAENNVYAFDAHNPNPTPIWQYFAGPPAIAGRVYADADQNISPAIGIISTPVIDLIHSTLYFVAMSQPNPDKDDFNHTLHAIDIPAGKVRGTVVITGSIAGGGSFNSQRENQRAALALVQDRIYIAWASFADHAPFDGLVMSYASMDTATPLKKMDQFQAAQADPLIGKRSKGGGIWHSGGGPAVDDRGDSIYVVTGNGDSSNTHAGSDFDSSTVKLDLSLNVADYYTPSYQNFLNENDLDLSVAGPMIPEDQFDAQGRRVKLLMHGSKAGLVYVLNRDGLGKFNEHSNNIIQTLRVFPDADDLAHQMTPSHIHTTPVYWRGPGGPRIYIASDYKRWKPSRHWNSLVGQFADRDSRQLSRHPVCIRRRDAGHAV